MPTSEQLAAIVVAPVQAQPTSGIRGSRLRASRFDFAAPLVSGINFAGVKMVISRIRQHAEDMFKRIQKPPKGAGTAESSSQLGLRTLQDFKAARLRKLRLAREADAKSRPNHNTK